MSSIDIDISLVSPYLSVIIGVVSQTTKYDTLHKKILKLITINDLENAKISSDLIGESGEYYISGYSVERIPGWSKISPIKDIENNILITIFAYGYVAIFISDKSRKEDIRDNFSVGVLKEISPIPIPELNGNFINEDKIRMLWLSGIHGRGNFKADTKVLSGDSVADTLDPLLDQSYMMSAVRTELWQASTKKTIGINPFKSSVWRGPCSDWATFESRVIEILNILHSNKSNVDNPISILSYPVSDCKGLQDAYDFSLVDYEFFSDNEKSNKRRLIERILTEFQFEIVPSALPEDISLKISKNSQEVGTIKARPIIKNYKVSFETTDSDIKIKTSYDSFKKVFDHPEIIKCWFESGHAIVNGMIFKTGYRDVSFSGYTWADYENYNILKEKPGKDPKKPELDKIGQEKSLFCWVKNRWNGKWDENTPFNTTENPTGWLLCDDGAGEKADFIHYVHHNNEHVISLIHVKAAKDSSPNRKISVGAHDIVLSQSVKNIRSCDRKKLVEDLKIREKTNSNKMCWESKTDNLNGKESYQQTTMSEFIKKMESLKDNGSVRTRVVVVQPHTRKSYYTSTLSNTKKQLDVLLVSAENAVNALGCEFHIIGSDT
ncbi:hypothetical protein FU839_04615 [Rheinheimera tangshanensis]|uniref:Uncharacterized protein n=1 Tax=Rheinheimera tangshanensis TaxID=400153 RepID=A0A5C8LYS5_9GAMM|nr:hypothetical protein FU839_04615 [Rheinheimera tangshanensis]